MITLLIVDDEVMVRKGLSKEFDWQTNGITIIGEAANGKDGLSLALSNHPDIVITDIRMPGGDGLHMATKIREQLPVTSIIFLSGYSDFEYARSAIELGAVDYLLKPVIITELQTVIKKVKARIEKERSSQIKDKAKDALLLGAIPFLKARLFNDFSNSSIKLEVFVEKAKLMDINLDGPRYQFFVLEFDNPSINFDLSYSQRSSLEIIIQNQVESLLGSGSHCSIAYVDYSIMGLISTSHEMKQIIDFAEKIRSDIYIKFSCAIMVGLGQQVLSIKDIGLSLRQALTTLDYKISIGTNSVIVSTEASIPEIALIIPSLEEERVLVENLRVSKAIEIASQIDFLFEKYILSHPVSRKSAEHFCFNILGIGFRELRQSGLSPELIFGKDRNIPEEIGSQNNLSSIVELMKSVFSEILDGLDSQRGNKCHAIVKLGMAYAQEHYTTPLQLQDIAEMVKVTPNYFSRLFKQDVGENFIEWLTKFRIEKAQNRLVDTPESKTYEIATDVGFKDYKYFAYIFKKYTGYTPGTYRKMMLSGRKY